jgi:hypothetical protein
VREVQGAGDELAHVGIGVSGSDPSHASTAFRVSRIVTNPRPLIMRSMSGSEGHHHMPMTPGAGGAGSTCDQWDDDRAPRAMAV